ncbi:MAG: hypothetical protein QOC83_6422 [Pseudonocardiales bacterium]|jgi:hypothetical protein|nr:hypothetical protein [Pseudonocardiales bacterium]MDT7611727.1 hypothetical protein [Pseudonocardiales bacterium]MDT7642134.1 hypothetical protein [Pseudonocardiales bacterium]
MTRTLARQDSSAQAPDPIGDGRDRGTRRIIALAVMATVAASLLAAAYGPSAAYGFVGGAFAIVLLVTSALYPIFATYAYLITLPIIAGIDRDTLLPLVRPNEGLLAVVVAGAVLGAYLRYVRGDAIRPRFYPLIDVPLAVFLLASTVWPLASLTLRGLIPGSDELAGTLPMAKLVGIYFLVRYTVTTEQRIMRTIRFIVWPGAVVALIAVLQTLKFGPVLALLDTFWNSGAGAADTQDLSERGSATLGSPIATGDVIIISLVLVLCCGARGLLGRRERLILAMVLSTGVLAAGQFSTWIATAVAFALLAWRFPDLRRQARRFAPLALVALVIGFPAFVGRLSGIGENGSFLPEPEQGRLDNLAHMYLPHFNWVTTLIGVSPNEVLQAPERWREVIYLESGVLYFLWVGGIPLLAAFIWLSVRTLRSVKPALGHPGPFGAAASSLDIVWRFLLVLTLIDPHLQLRGTGDLIFTLLAIVATGLDQRGLANERHGLPSFMIGRPRAVEPAVPAG